MEVGTVSQEFSNLFAAQSETRDMKSAVTVSYGRFGYD